MFKKIFILLLVFGSYSAHAELSDIDKGLIKALSDQVSIETDELLNCVEEKGHGKTSGCSDILSSLVEVIQTSIDQGEAKRSELDDKLTNIESKEEAQGIFDQMEAIEEKTGNLLKLVRWLYSIYSFGEIRISKDLD